VAIDPEQMEALRKAVSAQPQLLDLVVIGQVKHAVIVAVARKINAS
jgi:hypothetical protein